LAHARIRGHGVREASTIGQIQERQLQIGAVGEGEGKLGFRNNILFPVLASGVEDGEVAVPFYGVP
jgi:hypothetical protein